MKRVFVFSLPLVLLLTSEVSGAGVSDLRLDVHQFRIVERESGKTNYYSVVNDASQPFIRAEYKPGYDTAVFGVQLPDGAKRARGLHWNWRARTLPLDAGTCGPHGGVADTAALVYVIWKRGLKWYTLRYVWSTSAPKGAMCNSKRNLFLGEDTVVLETGPGTDAWVNEEIDLASEFRRHFEGGDPNADVPDLVGVALFTDGDQTHSESAADYADLVLRN
jgi:hypothetical protein